MPDAPVPELVPVTTMTSVAVSSTGFRPLPTPKVLRRSRRGSFGRGMPGFMADHPGELGRQVVQQLFADGFLPHPLPGRRPA
ncbi:hypothetical protein [Nocardia sp. CY41]|uniref:hypothetical protein n=1 Tax=Nocardia sp. CY41 TaxID=2608686 RepID=UPI001359C0BF|nr:hypothetical protein [Nocardia sp. CY41]